ncbi:unnamed protein product [Gongylonema pulchrum]|uniref:UAS domain-containing protein n=1 Tax=Gongylonema pulchrum TaxID=637853 RepID=A0A183EE64_9BILA|nr:unnamed protein product [Gongylonema pulchrum]
MLQNGPTTSNQADDKRMTLQALFRPPIDIMFTGDWETVRYEASQRNQWLLINVQDDQEFACQTLNRDVWSNTAVKELIRSSFVFWQIHKDWADGNRICNYYRINSYPAIFVVDPRTGELLLTVKAAADAFSFCDQLATFLDSCPDYEARDRQLSAVQSSSGSSEQSASTEHVSPVGDMIFAMIFIKVHFSVRLKSKEASDSRQVRLSGYKQPNELKVHLSLS